MRGQIKSWTRPSLLTLAVGIATAIFLLGCAALIAPFLASLIWSLTLAVIVLPIYRRFSWHRYPGLGAGIAVLAVAFLVVGPFVLLAGYLFNQARTAIEMLQQIDFDGEWQRMLEPHVTLSMWMGWLQDQFDLKGQIQTVVQTFGESLPAMVGGSVWIAAQLLITLFVLYYFLRDGTLILKWLREQSPFSERETSLVFNRVRDCLHATVLGNIFTSLIQGALGGLMMGFLGFPFPVLWGAVMALFSLIPTFGAPVVWVPAALILVAQGEWVNALILSVWGAFVIGLIDNVLYPIFVGQKVTLHTVPVLFSYLGGIVLFGFSGLVLGPLIVTLSWTFLEIWRQRTARGRDATEAIALDVS